MSKSSVDGWKAVSEPMVDMMMVGGGDFFFFFFFFGGSGVAVEAGGTGGVEEVS